MSEKQLIIHELLFELIEKICWIKSLTTELEEEE